MVVWGDASIIARGSDKEVVMAFTVQEENRTKVRWLTVLRDGHETISVVARRYDAVWMVYVMKEGKTIHTTPCRPEAVEHIYQRAIKRIEEAQS